MEGVEAEEMEGVEEVAIFLLLSKQRYLPLGSWMDLISSGCDAAEQIEQEKR